MTFNEKPTICVVGLGYVGLPLAYLFGKTDLKTYGFDVKEPRINELKNGTDSTRELSAEQLKETNIEYTTDPGVIAKSDFVIVAVPTPVDKAHQPDLTPVIKASETVGKNLQKNSVVVFEPTVYPGVTEEICVPIIEKLSGLKCGVDWSVGYSPERVNPGDKEHTTDKILKVVSGLDEATTDYIDKIYRKVITAGTFKAKNIKTAEAAKVIENTQRDINIALINELSQIFCRLNINTFDVLEASGTKWNFLNFKPGLVGGHCIGVDPYYLLQKAEICGYHPQLISVSRRINDDMSHYCADQIIKLLISSGKVINISKILIMGATFKENIKDNRNSKVAELINELKKFQIEVFVYEPNLKYEELGGDFSIDNEHFIEKIDNLNNFDGICYAVDHKDFSNYDLKKLREICNDNAILFDVKGKFAKSPEKNIFNYKSL